MTDLLSGGDTALFWERVRWALETLRPSRLPKFADPAEGTRVAPRPAMDPETDAALGWAWQTARRLGAPVSLLLVGIDREDDYLRSYGAQAAEECAVLVGDAISSALPRGEVSFLRFGPSEYLVLLPGREKRAARKLGRQLIAAVRGCRLNHKESHAGVVTASIGLTSAAPACWSAAEVLRRAETGLRKAQRGGLSRTAVYELRGSTGPAA